MNMNNNIITKSLLLSALTLGSVSLANAATGSFDVGFRTITDVTITETQALSFGATMFQVAGGVCDMALTFATVSDVDAAAVRGTPVTTTASGSVSGAGCITTAAGGTGNQIGIYSIAGISGADVKVTVNEVLGSEFNYVPNTGCVVNYDGTAAADTETCDTFFPGTPITVTLANGTDAGATDGELRVLLGGRVTVNTELTSDTNYAQQFTIDATY